MIIQRERHHIRGRKPKSPRQIRVDGDMAFLPLTRGYEAIIDAEDVHLIDWRVWWVRLDRRRDGTIRTAYAIARDFSDKGIALHLHRVIMDTPDDMVVDHLNGDGLDCRKCNMRNVKQAQNSINRRIYRNNTSGSRGVSWHKNMQKWTAQISLGGKFKYLGAFDDIADAKAAYLCASATIHGEFGEAASRQNVGGEG